MLFNTIYKLLFITPRLIYKYKYYKFITQKTVYLIQLCSFTF